MTRRGLGSYRWRRAKRYLCEGETPKRGDVLYLDYYINGKRKRPPFDTLRTNSQSEFKRIETSAQNYLNKISETLDNGTEEEIFEITGTSYPTYEQMAHFWWEKDYCEREYMKDPQRQSSDLGKLNYGIKFFRNDEGESLPGNKIDREKVKTFRMHLKQIGVERKWKDAYINRIVAMVGQVYHGCIEEEFYTSEKADERELIRYGRIELCVRMKNPVHGLPKYYEEPVNPVVPTYDQFLKLLANLIPVLRYCAMIGIHTGLRKRNIFNLRIGEVKLISKELVIGSTKGVLPIILKMHPDLVKLFSHLSEFWRVDQEFVFEKIPGVPFKSLNASWKKGCEAAGIVGFQFRNLRTTYGTWRVEEGISMPLLQAALGHTTSQTTSRFYNKARHATEQIVKTQRSVWCDQICDQSVTK